MRFLRLKNSTFLLIFPVILFFCLSSAADSFVKPQKIRVVMGDNYPPFVFRDSKGNPAGIVPEMWQLWERYNGIRVTILVTDWNEAQQAIKSGRADIIEALFRTPDREKIYSFSRPYKKALSVNIFHDRSIVGIGNFDALKGFMVAVIKGDAAVKVLFKHGINSLTFYRSYEDIVRDAKSGKVKVFCMDEPPALYYLGKYNLWNTFREGFSLYRSDVYRAALKKNEALLKFVEHGFDNIPERELEAVFHRWLGKPIFRFDLVKYVLWITGSSGLLIIILFLWNISLNARVRQKTREISNLLGSIRDKEELVRTTLYSIADGIITTDSDGRVRRMNSVAEELTGWREFEAAGKPIDEIFNIVNEHTREKAMNPVERVLSEGVVVGLANHTILISRDGTERPIADSAAPIRTADGRLVGTVIVFRDQTRERESKNKLERALEQLNLALDSANLAILHAHLPDGRLYYDKRWADMLGFDEGNEVPSDLKHWEAFIHPDDKEGIMKGLKSHISGKIPIFEKECRIKHRSGQWMWIYLKGKVIERDVDGNAISCSGIAMDVTEQKLIQEKVRTLEEQLAHTAKLEAIGRLAGGIAHDFNNILQVIIGHGEMASTELDVDSPHIRSRISEILKAAHKAARVVHQLLAFARKGVSNPIIINLNNVIRESVSMFRRFMGEQIELRCRLDPELWDVFMDPVQLEQVLVNLIINSRDAIEETGEIVIETSNVDISQERIMRATSIVPGRYVKLSVIDDGCGMTEETLERIFEPFFTTKDAGKGTGLGMSMVYGIVKQHNGVIDISSEVGKGTRVDIYFPRSDATGIDVERDGQGREQKARSKRDKVILLVEDDRDILSLVGDFLKAHGYKVHCFSDPSGVLIWLESNPSRRVDLLITDVVMPGMSGPQLWDIVKRRIPKVRCLFVSGYADERIAKYGILESSNFLRKPYSVQQLIERIDAILEQ